MNSIRKDNLTADEALDLIYYGQKLNNLHIIGKLDLTKFYKGTFDKDIVANNCTFEYLQASSIEFAKTVKFTNCEFRKCEFVFTYFLSGLLIDNCSFKSYLDFQAGGHNRKGSIVSITNTIFKNFVNFFDCWYQSDVVVKNNDFQKGTNLLGGVMTSGIKTRFDVDPIIENNKGKLDVNDEGDIEINSIHLS